MRESLMRLLDWFRRGRLDRELAEELAFHRAQLERDARAAGADPVAARRAASRRLGNTTAVREASRERWSWPRLESLHQDVRYAMRSLRRDPGFTATVVLTLGLGIGANLAMFSVVDRLMFRPLWGLRAPEDVHRVYLQELRRGELRTRPTWEYTRYLDLRGGTSSFALTAAFSERPLAVGVGADTRERRVGAVSASYFRFFDAQPALGRFFAEEEDRTPRGADVAVLSYAYWQTEFGGADVRGRTLQVGNVSARIIGVAPRGFAGVNDAEPPAVWIPITSFAGSAGPEYGQTYFTEYNWGWLNMLVRRKPGVSESQASADLTTAFRASWERQRQGQPTLPPVDVAKPRALVGSVRPWAGPDPALEARTALWVGGIALMVLVIACANVANLALARTLRRGRETAVRLALGAGRRRIVTQALVENLLLASAGAALGLALAGWGSVLVGRMLVGTMVDQGALASDGRTMLVTALLALATGLATGIVPALFAVRGDLAPALRGGTRGGTGRHAGVRAALLVVQCGLTVVLLVGATLFVRSLQSVQSMPMGYQPDRVLRVNRIERGATPTLDERVALRRRLLDAAQALPQVEAAAWVNSVPFNSTSSTALFVEGIDSVGALGDFTFTATTPDYFRVMGTRIVRGRPLMDGDRQGAPPVMVVGESMARRLWPTEDAIGKCITVSADTMPCYTVVGIAEDMVQRDVTADERYHYYLPLDQYPRTQGNGLMLKLRGDPALLGETVRAALQAHMTGASYLTVQPLAEIVGDAQRSWRTGATLLLAFGGLALAVAAVGLYGVVSYGVAQRLHEIGVRIALGATPRRILGLVVGSSVRLVLFGSTLGILIALWGAKWVQPLLFRQSATDPRVYALVGGLMVLVALGASLSPARRANRTDPITALRAE